MAKLESGPDVTNADNEQIMLALADGIRKSGQLGKSSQLNLLFDFLVDQSVQGKAPKEIEIAHSVFNKPSNTDFSIDATVRVTAHRLRKKLETVAAGAGGRRIALPPGEYRLVVERIDETAEPLRPATSPLPRRRLYWAVGVLCAINVAAWAWATSGPSRDHRLDTALWRDLAHGHDDLLLVAGDYYLFGELDAQGKPGRVIGDPTINSREDLDEYKMRHPQFVTTYVDLNAHDLPGSMAPALAAVLPVFTTIQARTARPSTSLTMSHFTTDMLGNHDIVYVGLLNCLGNLRAPLMEASNFDLNDGDQALIDHASRRRFSSDWVEAPGQPAIRNDYAYLASFAGPSGNRVVVIAGEHEPGLLGAAAIAADPAKLDELGARVGSAAAFEAIYKVSTFGPSNVAATLVLARPIQDRRPAPIPGPRTGTAVKTG